VEQQRNILVVLPHPDDECFGLAGSLTKHVRDGDYITYACLTLGEMGRNMGVPPFANRVTLPQIRKAELELSCRAIGIQDLRLLGFHDKTIEFEDKSLLDGKVLELLKERRPSIVYTFYPGYSVHPDHDACGAAVVRATAALPLSSAATSRSAWTAGIAAVPVSYGVRSINCLNAGSSRIGSKSESSLAYDRHRSERSIARPR